MFCGNCILTKKDNGQSTKNTDYALVLCQYTNGLLMNSPPFPPNRPPIIAVVVNSGKFIMYARSVFFWICVFAAFVSSFQQYLFVSNLSNATAIKTISILNVVGNKHTHNRVGSRAIVVYTGFVTEFFSEFSREFIVAF